MDNQIAVAFAFEGQNVRVILGQDGEPWFVAADVAQQLEYRMASDMTRWLDADEKGTQTVRTPSGHQAMLVISESGLYAAVLKSRKPEAKAFKKWVTAEVLPSIRKTGRYQLPTAPMQPALPQTFAQALRLAAEQAEQIELQAKQLEAAKPAIAFTQAVSDMTGCLLIGNVGKTLGHGRTRFFARLRADGILMNTNLPYQEYLDKGYFKVVEREPWQDSKGEKHPSLTTMVTGKGQVWLARRYPPAKEVLKAARKASKQ